MYLLLLFILLFQMAKDLVAKKRLLSAIEERGLNLLPRLPLKAPELFEWSLIEVN